MGQRLSFSLNLKTAAGAIGGLVLLSSASTFLLNSNKTEIPNFNIFSSISSAIYPNLEKTGGSIQTFFGSLSSLSFLSFLGNFSKIPDFGQIIKGYWSSIPGIFEKGSQKISQFFNSAFDGAKTIYQFLVQSIPTFWTWIQESWTSVYKKIYEKFEINTFQENFLKVFEFYKEQFLKLKTNTSKNLKQFFQTYYRAIFRILFPWTFSFMEEAVFSKEDLKQIWKHLYTDGKFKETMKEIFKFFRKYQNILEKMNSQERKEIIKLFFQNSAGFIEKLKELNSSDAAKKGDAKNLISLLKKNESHLKTQLKILKTKEKVKSSIKKIITSTSKAIKSIEDKIFPKKGNQKSISEEISKIVEAETDSFLNIGANFLGEGWSFLEDIFTKKNE